MIGNDQFHTDTYNTETDSLDTAITFHHLKEWKDYALYSTIL